jgi:hypothetical protein
LLHQVVNEGFHFRIGLRCLRDACLQEQEEECNTEDLFFHMTFFSSNHGLRPWALYDDPSGLVE